MKNDKAQPIPKIRNKIKIRIQIDEVQSLAVTVTIIDIMPDGRVKVEYEHPIRCFKQITITKIKYNESNKNFLQKAV